MKQEAKPEFYAVQRNAAGGWAFSRRSLFRAAAAAAASAAALRGDNRAGAACPGNAYSGLSLAVTPDGSRLFSGSWPDAAAPGSVGKAPIKIWSLPDGALLGSLKEHTGMVNSLALTPDGRLLASGSSDKNVCLWSLPGGTLLKTLSGHANEVSSVAISPDGRWLASGAGQRNLDYFPNPDRTIKLWSLPDGALVRTLPGHTGDGVGALAISPDGRLLASGGGDKTIKLWSLPDGALRATLAGHTSLVKSLVFSPDGRLLASAAGRYFGYSYPEPDKTIRLWSMPDGMPLKSMVGHTDGVNSVAFTPDGRLLVSGSSDKCVKLWSVPDATLLNSLGPSFYEQNAVAISRDGGILVAGGGISLVLYSLPDAKLLPICLEDPAAACNAESVRYTLNDVTYTLPKGAALPPNATCTCNTVAGPIHCGGGCGIWTIWI